MNEDYLWDGSGEPEPDVARLERVLQDWRWPAQRSFSSEPYRPRRRPWTRLAAAAALAAFCFGTAWLVRRTKAPQPVTSWQLTLAHRKPSMVRLGQVIETLKNDRARVESPLVGELTLEPGSRLRVMRGHAAESRMALDRGTMQAFIWAPPARFVVDTPSAKTVDLGCRYTLSVAANGNGNLTVQMGWVAFEWRGLESFIPAGAACTTSRARGPATPHFLDASQALVRALAEFDRTGSPPALGTVLDAARPRDALTLWHLLQRTQGAERARVFERFAQLVELPSTVTRESVLRGDRKSMDAAWDALRLGNTDWWRKWKSDW